MRGGAGRATKGGASALERARRPVKGGARVGGDRVPAEGGAAGISEGSGPGVHKGRGFRPYEGWGYAGLRRGTGICKRRSFADLRGAWLEGHLRGPAGGRWKEVWKGLTGSEGL